MRKHFIIVLFAVISCCLAPASFGNITLSPLATGLSLPVDIANAGDGSGRLFIVEQGGKIRIIQNGFLLATPFLNLTTAPSIVTSGGEQGLLGLAFHPQYATNGQFFVYFNSNANAGAGIATGDIVIARFQRSATDPNLADPASIKVILTIPHSTFTNHNGGSLRFGPDGYLYAGVGDGGGGGDPFGSGQNRNTLLGKILRINVTGVATYTVPASNPFVGVGGTRPEIWAYGVRNPWRFSFDRTTGDLYIGDVGQDTWEEIDRQAAGSSGGINYGWNVCEGNHRYPASIPAVACVPPASYVAPILEYDHTIGNAITGGYVYRGLSTPELAGKYVFGDYIQSKLFYAPTTGATYTQMPGLTVTVSTFGEGESGELYLANYASGAISSFSSLTDNIPDPLTFSPVTNVPLNNTTTSNLVKITGLGTLANLSISSGGEYTLSTSNATSCSNSYTNAGTTVATDTYICVRHNSGITYGTKVTTTLTVGTATIQFDTTTIAAPPTFSVTPSVGPNGFLSPNIVRLIAQGQTTTFVITPAAGYVAAVGGTCGGTLNGVNYTTLPITANCTVVATFSLIPPSPPGAPIIGGAAAGDGLASVSFSPPASNGGSAITLYTANCNGILGSGTQSPVIVKGLTNDTLYSCRVFATNIAGPGPFSASVDVTPTANVPLALIGVQSRKTHGGNRDFDLPIDPLPLITELVSVEPRMIGSGHRIVFQFNVPIDLVTSLVAEDAMGASLPGMSSSISGNELTVLLTGIADNQRVKVSMAGALASNTSTLPGISASVGFLVGDVNSSRAVNASDISGVKARFSQALDLSNFQFDLNASGAIDSADLSAVKARSGLLLP